MEAKENGGLINDPQVIADMLSFSTGTPVTLDELSDAVAELKSSAAEQPAGALPPAPDPSTSESKIIVFRR